MEIGKKVLSIYRVLEAIPGYDRGRVITFAARAKKIMTDDERVMMGNVGKAMILLTAGNQKTIRDPNSFDASSVYDKYVALTDVKMWRAIETIGLNIDLDDKPTKEDYELAHKLLPFMGASITTQDDLDMNIGANTISDLKYGTSGKAVLYRGINNMDINTMKYVAAKNTWDMTRGVSTSFSPKESHKFAGMKPGSWHGSTKGPAILFVIDNLKKRGFHASSLSKYSREREVILAGNVTINSVKIEARGLPEPGTYPAEKKGQLSRMDLKINPLVRVTIREETNSAVFASEDSRFNQSINFPHFGKSFGEFVEEMFDTMKIKNYVSADGGLHDLVLLHESLLIIANVEME